MKFMVIDIQGFYISSEFIPKEVTFLSGKHSGHFLLKPPKPFSALDNNCKKQTKWLEQNHHGIKYSEGLIPLEDMQVIIKKLVIDQNVNVIYVKGNEKKTYLQNILQGEDISIVDLFNATNCPSLHQKINTPCLHHFKSPHVCSYRNCKILYDWIMTLLPV